MIQQIIVEQTFNFPRHVIWRAITEIDQMHQWFFPQIESFIAEPGFKTEFDVHSEDRVFRHLWQVTEVVPYVRIRYNWKYEGYAGDSFVVFELSDKPEGTLLRLTHQVTEIFPQDIPEFKRESGEAGWNYLIKTALRDFINKSTV